MVGDDGVRVSGGERQRLAIARVVLAVAPIVVLDEATSHLDARTEIAVAAALDGYLRGRTAIVLGHRSRILGLADRRLALDTA
jgi:ABC-type multidrug transport system fused ATPase/permease subunit